MSGVVCVSVGRLLLQQPPIPIFSQEFFIAKKLESGDSHRVVLSSAQDEFLWIPGLTLNNVQENRFSNEPRRKSFDSLQKSVVSESLVRMRLDMGSPHWSENHNNGVEEQQGSFSSQKPSRVIQGGRMWYFSLSFSCGCAQGQGVSGGAKVLRWVPLVVLLCS